MKKLLICSVLFFWCQVCFAVPNNTITTPNTFTANNIIYSSEVNSNFTEIQTKFNNHHHVIVSADITDGTIVNADINTSAAIAASKLDTTVVETDTTQTISGDKTVSGGTTFSGSLTATGTVTLPATDVVIGTANQGDIFYDDGTDLTRLTPGTSGQFLQTKGAAANPVWGSLVSIPTNMQVFTSSGTWDWDADKPDTVWVRVWGGGGGGDSANEGGGGGGGYSEEFIAVTADATVTVGAGGIADGGGGGAGGTSSFIDTATIQATGGAGGLQTTGGAGGVGSNGTLNLTGQRGGKGTTNSDLSEGGAAALGGTGGRNQYITPTVPGGGGEGAVNGAAGLVIVYY